MSPKTFEAMLPLVVGLVVFLVAVGIFRAARRWKLQALRVVGVLVYYVACAMVSVEKPTAAVVLAAALPLFFIVRMLRRRRPEHVAGSTFTQPASVEPAQYRPAYTPEQRRGIEVAAAWPDIASRVGLIVADAGLSHDFREMQSEANSPEEGFLGAAAGFMSTRKVAEWRDDPAKFIRGNQVYRLPLVRLVDVTEFVTTLHVSLPHGLHLDDLDKAIPALTQAYRAYMIQFEQPRDALAAGVVVLRVVHADPLAQVEALSRPLEFTGDWKHVPVGFKTSGEVATIKVENVSGTVIGGLPGSGKTASIMSTIAVLAQRADVQFHVFDGKGGHDWSWLEPRALTFNRDDEDREAVAHQLEALVQIMRDRLDEMPKLRDGDFSLWAKGPSVDLPLLVVVLDECQTYFDKGEIPRGDKEAEAARQRCESAVATLVRKGRSAGVWVIPTTQKPTSDSLPTTIGANTASQIAFRVKTSQAEQAIFGEAPEPGEVSARNLPEASGYAVLASETGTREVVRFAYVPPNVLVQIGRESSHLRHDPTEFEDDGLGPTFVKQIEG